MQELKQFPKCLRGKKKKTQNTTRANNSSQAKTDLGGTLGLSGCKHLVPFSKECDQTVTLWQFRDAEAS